MRTVNRGSAWIKKHYYIVYTIGFAVIASLTFSVFLRTDKGFVWSVDGQKQHLAALVYYSEWLKQIVKNLIENHAWVIPMWDMSIGQGSDILTTLHYYVIGDPLNLLSLFVRAENMESLYSGLVLLRIFLAGISFSVYCFAHKKGRRATLIGAYMYAFSSFALYFAIRHPYFVNPMIYMPLMFLGIDKIYRKEKPYVFIFSTCVAAASNFYFCYMIVIACVLYALIVYKKEVGTYQWKEIMYYVGKMTAYGILSVLLAAVVFVPNAMAVLFTGRMGVENYVPTLFNLEYYERLFASVVTQHDVGYSARPGVMLPAATAVFILFIKKGKRELKAGFTILMLGFCIPFIGSAMNGFSYVSYRCSFISSFLLSYIFVSVCNEMVSLTKKEKICLVISALVYTAIVLCMESVQGKQLYVTLAAFWVSVIFVMCVHYNEKGYRLFTCLCLLMLVGGIVMSSDWLYSPGKNGYALEFVKKNTAVERISNKYASGESRYVNPSDVLRDYAAKDELARVDMYGAKDISHNSAMLQRVNGISYYFSMVNPYISQFHKEMGLLRKTEFNYRNLDCRSYLQTLNNVKYFISSKKNRRRYNPVLFQEKAVKSQGGYSLYETEDNVGFAYAYDRCLSRAKYEDMNCAEKQEAVLQVAVVDDDKVSADLEEAGVTFTLSERDYVIETDDKIKIKDGQIKVLRNGASMTLRFEGLENSETYVLMQGLEFDAEDMWRKKTDKKRKKAEKEELYRLNRKALYHSPLEETNIGASSDVVKGKKSLLLFNARRNFYSGLKDFLWNFGYSDKAASYVTFTFREKGDYSFDELKVYCQPVNDLSKKIKRLKIDGGDSFTAGTNSFAGHVVLDEKRYVCFSLPYSEGWKVYINGEEKELLQTNTMFMSVLLDKGEYNIELKYTTPYLIEGIIMSFCGFIILAIMILADKKGRKRVSNA